MLSPNNPQWSYRGNVLPRTAVITVMGQSFTVNAGDTFPVSSSFDTTTSFRIGLSAAVDIHLSCSAPLRANDQFGSLVVLGGPEWVGRRAPGPRLPRTTAAYTPFFCAGQEGNEEDDEIYHFYSPIAGDYVWVDVPRAVCTTTILPLLASYINNRTITAGDMYCAVGVAQSSLP